MPLRVENNDSKWYYRPNIYYYRPINTILLMHSFTRYLDVGKVGKLPNTLKSQSKSSVSHP